MNKLNKNPPVPLKNHHLQVTTIKKVLLILQKIKYTSQTKLFVNLAVNLAANLNIKSNLIREKRLNRLLIKSLLNPKNLETKKVKINSNKKILKF